MRIRAIGMTVVAVMLLSGGSRVQTKQNLPATVFVGTTPCSEAVRAFVGSIAPGALCHAIAWRLDLGVTDGNGPRWSLDATYGVPTASSPGMANGPRVSTGGRLERTGTTYRLIADNGRSMSFRQVSSTLLHALDARNRLMLGTAAASYTLGRADVTDDPGQPEQRPGGSYTIPPRDTGSTVLGVFVGRTPCMGIARALRMVLADGCQRVKWRITLRQQATTREPTTYKIEGSLHHTGREGAWRIARGTASDADAVVYQLDGTAAEGPMLRL